MEQPVTYKYKYSGTESKLLNGLTERGNSHKRTEMNRPIDASSLSTHSIYKITLCRIHCGQHRQDNMLSRRINDWRNKLFKDSDIPINDR